VTLNTQQLDDAISTDPTIPTDDTQAAALPGWGAPIVAPKPYLLGPRKLLDVCWSVDPINGLKGMEWCAAALQKNEPVMAGVFLRGGGIDVSNPAIAAMLDTLAGQSANADPPGPFTQAMADAAKALGQSSTYLFGAPVAPSDVTASRARVSRIAAYTAARQLASHQFDAATASINAADLAGQPAPTPAQVLGILGTQQP
jgi:hypothetical protein